MLDASTAFWSSAFHLFITLFEKKYFVMSLVHLAFTSLQERPLVTLQCIYV